MRRASGWLAVGLLAVGLGLPQAASALSLADLIAGGTVDSLDGNLTFGDFVLSGKLKKVNLGAITVTSVDGGFALDLSTTKKLSGTLGFTATPDAPRELDSASLALTGSTKSSANATVSSGAVTLVELPLSGGGANAGGFAPVSSANVSTALGIKKNTGALTHSFGLTAAPADIPGVPEPATLLLLAPAAVLLARRVRKQA
jgi:hypothetical protein